MNTTAHLTCSSTYLLSGSNSSTCEISGNWSPQTLTCQGTDSWQKTVDFHVVFFFGIHGRGVCVAGDMHDRRTCVAGGMHGMEQGMHGRGVACMAGGVCMLGDTWQGACMVGVCVCMAGGMCGRGYMTGGMHGRRDGNSYWILQGSFQKFLLLLYPIINVIPRSNINKVNSVIRNRRTVETLSNLFFTHCKYHCLKWQVYISYLELIG